MNCDQAFDVMTSHNGSEDRALQHHLAQCPRCRDMAEMLQPALELFHGTSPDASNGDVWQNQQDWRNETAERRDYAAADGVRSCDEQVEATSARFRSTARPWLTANSNRRSAPVVNGARIVAFLLLIGMVMVAVGNISREDRQSPNQPMIALPDHCQRADQTDASSSVVIAGCVSCHMNAEWIADMRPQQASLAAPFIQRCVSCHLDRSSQPGEGQPEHRSCLFQVHDLHQFDDRSDASI